MAMMTMMMVMAVMTITDDDDYGEPMMTIASMIAMLVIRKSSTRTRRQGFIVSVLLMTAF